MKMDNTLLHDLLDRNKLEGYISGMAYRMWTLPKSKFYYTYKINDLPLLSDPVDKTHEAFDIKEYLNNLGLNHIEKLWVETCLEYNFNYKLVGKKTGISRVKVSERIKDIVNKYKNTH